MRTLADFPTRRNGLNFIRLALAVSVIVSHAWPLGLFGPDPHLGTFNLGSFAVAGFFALSGWLVTQSRLKNGFRTYAWHRFCRIYPGYLVALLAVAFIFGPIGAAMSAGHYRISDGISYVFENSALVERRLSIAGTLPDWAFPAWNGSLWTLAHEVGCYVVIGLLITVVGRHHIALWSIFGLFAFTAASIAAPHVSFYVPGLLRVFFQFAPFFFAGAVLYTVREHVVMRWQGAMLAVVVTLAFAWASLPPTLTAIPIAYGMLWLGAALPTVLQKIGRRNDISYGVYIYAFPVQQLLTLAGATHAGVAIYVVCGVIGTLPLAAISWFAVERPAQRLRHVFDRRPDADRVTKDGRDT